MYQGRGINDWLRKLSSAISHYDLQKRHEAEEAVPTLLGQLALKGPANGYELIWITNALIKIDPEAALRAGIQPSSVEQP